jgi:hypothetical protein
MHAYVSLALDDHDFSTAAGERSRHGKADDARADDDAVNRAQET